MQYDPTGPGAGCGCCSLAILVVVVPILTIIVLAVLGPAIGHVFSNIVTSL